MDLLFAVVLCVFIVIIATIRERLKGRSDELSAQIKGLASYSDKSNYEQTREREYQHSMKEYLSIFPPT